jgi:hypothetical protein
MTHHYSPASLTVRSPWRLLWLGIVRAFSKIAAAVATAKEAAKVAIEHGRSSQ